MVLIPIQLTKTTEMNILVTGANGFIGRHLCEFLVASGHKVTRGVRRLDDQSNSLILDETTPALDLLKALSGINCIIHLAGIAHVYSKASLKIQDQYQSINVDFPRRLAEAARDAGVKRFVFISSIKVSGEESTSRALNEGDVCMPADPYSKSKWAAEKALQLIQRESSLEVVVVRPPLVYGPGVKANFSELLFAVRMRIPLPLGSLENKRSLLYVKNLVSALTLCATERQAAGKTFSIADSNSVTLLELVAEISTAMGKTTRTFKLSRRLLAALGFLFRKQQQIASLTKRLEVDSSKICKTLGWIPQYHFKTAIRDTVDWYENKAGSWGKGNDKQLEQNRPKKVCQLCAVDFTLLHLLLPLIDAMLARGWQVTSVCSEGNYAKELRTRGYKHHAISVSRNIFDLISHFRAIHEIFKLLREERFDVLHVHTPIASILGRIAGKLAGVPLIVYTAHGFYFHDQMSNWQYRIFVGIERLGSRLTDFFFTQSSEDAQTAILERIASEPNVLAIGNGVSVEKFSPDQSQRNRIRSQLGLSEDAFMIGIVARLVREKGLAEFLEAAKIVGSRYPHTYFMMIGERLRSDHNASVDWELSEAQRELGSRLIVTGYSEDVPLFLGGMDLFCLPSYREGMPRSIIEAMMMALPVVSTNIRGAREEVVPGVTGFLVPTRNVSALVDSFTTLILDVELGRRMGKAGRQRAIELYDEKDVVTRQIEVISTLMNGKNNSIPRFIAKLGHDRIH